jgi:hypothetical protein
LHLLFSLLTSCRFLVKEDGIHVVVKLTTKSSYIAPLLAEIQASSLDIALVLAEILASSLGIALRLAKISASSLGVYPYGQQGHDGICYDDVLGAILCMWVIN